MGAGPLLTDLGIPVLAHVGVDFSKEGPGMVLREQADIALQRAKAFGTPMLDASEPSDANWGWEGVEPWLQNATGVNSYATTRDA